MIISEGVAKIEDDKKLLAPQVKELSPEEIAKMFPKKEEKVEEIVIEESQLEPSTLSKRDWL